MLMSNKGRQAKLHYLDGTFRMLSPGDHVLCAVTHVPLPVEDLRYWSVKRQEAYASAQASAEADERERPGRTSGRGTAGTGGQTG